MLFYLPLTYGPNPLDQVTNVFSNIGLNSGSSDAIHTSVRDLREALAALIQLARLTYHVLPLILMEKHF